ncbi:lysozyme [Stagnihabitans tardus]|nr:lysozyme [Stagnihabitans tardus]
MKSRLAMAAGLMAAAVALVGGFEGRRLSAYLDGGGVPTICFGATKGVRLGDTATAGECDSRLRADLVEHEAALRACLKAPDAIPDQSYLALVSWAFNVGTGAACKSTAVRLVNAGDLRAACNQLPRWVRDNGRVIPGLVNRRQSEQALCLEGLR